MLALLIAAAWWGIPFLTLAVARIRNGGGFGLDVIVAFFVISFLGPVALFLIAFALLDTDQADRTNQ